jgi:large subunit ribosomal protein L6
MSRVGRKPIKVPAKVKVSISPRSVKVEGPLGNLTGLIPPGVALELEADVVRVIAPPSNRKNRGYQGLMRALLQNMIHGVVTGYRHELENNGVGYKFELKGKQLVISAGFSHTVCLDVPQGIKATVDKTQTKLVLESIDKILGGQFAATIFSVKKPEPYKGKGINYVGREFRRKAGKAGSK